MENSLGPPDFGETKQNKTNKHATYLQQPFWQIKHSQYELVLVWAAELLLTVRWKWFLVHVTFPALAHLNTWLLQLSAWEASYYLIVGDEETKAWVSRGMAQPWASPMITVQLWLRWQQMRSYRLQMQLIIYSVALPRKEVDLRRYFEGKVWGLLNPLLTVLKRNENHKPELYGPNQGKSQITLK